MPDRRTEFLTEMADSLEELRQLAADLGPPPKSKRGRSGLQEQATATAGEIARLAMDLELAAPAGSAPAPAPVPAETAEAAVQPEPEPTPKAEQVVERTEEPPVEPEPEPEPNWEPGPPEDVPETAAAAAEPPPILIGADEIAAMQSPPVTESSTVPVVEPLPPPVAEPEAGPGWGLRESRPEPEPEPEPWTEPHPEPAPEPEPETDFGFQPVAQPPAATEDEAGHEHVFTEVERTSAVPAAEHEELAFVDVNAPPGSPPPVVQPPPPEPEVEEVPVFVTGAHPEPQSEPGAASPAVHALAEIAARTGAAPAASSRPWSPAAAMEPVPPLAPPPSRPLPPVELPQPPEPVRRPAPAAAAWYRTPMAWVAAAVIVAVVIAIVVFVLLHRSAPAVHTGSAAAPTFAAVTVQASTMLDVATGRATDHFAAHTATVWVDLHFPAEAAGQDVLLHLTAVSVSGFAEITGPDTRWQLPSDASTVPVSVTSPSGSFAPGGYRLDVLWQGKAVASASFSVG